MDISNIKKVYSGRIGCACGCMGKYSYNDLPDTPDYASVNVRSVKIMAKRILNDSALVYSDCGRYAHVEDKVRNTSKIVYFVNPVVK